MCLILILSGTLWGRGRKPVCSGLMNDDYTDGIICPYEIPDQWQYEYDRQW